jgi:eukaryotic translation initiation factor 2C
MAAPAVPPERGTALEVWVDSAHEFYYPNSNATVPDVKDLPATNLVGRDWDQSKAERHLKKFKSDVGKIKQPGKFPHKTKFAKFEVATQTVLTNHFELEVQQKTPLYEYEILDLQAESQTRKKTQALFRKAIAQWNFLMNDQSSFATDGQKTIVSWKKLHESMNSNKLMQGNGQDANSAWNEDISTGKVTPVTARFLYVGKVKVDDLKAQTQCDKGRMNSDLSAVERCINILISKSFDNSAVIKSPGEKFDVREARDDLIGSLSLEIIRGYYYAVQSGIGSLLLNFNVATSAFFKPILVSEFLSDNKTFDNHLHRTSLLKRLRVYVENQHTEDRLNKMSARIKMIHALGEPGIQNIEDLFFHKKMLDATGKPYKDASGEWVRETTRTTVAKHHEDGE